jgi:hypothetical protein
VIALLDRQLASHRHQPELGRGSLYLIVGPTDYEPFERIIVSLPVALVARQLLQERPSGMAILEPVQVLSSSVSRPWSTRSTPSDMPSLSLPLARSGIIRSAEARISLPIRATASPAAGIVVAVAILVIVITDRH